MIAFPHFDPYILASQSGQVLESAGDERKTGPGSQAAPGAALDNFGIARVNKETPGNGRIIAPGFDYITAGCLKGSLKGNDDKGIAGTASGLNKIFKIR